MAYKQFLCHRKENPNSKATIRNVVYDTPFARELRLFSGLTE
jgi:hypothetical protein